MSHQELRRLLELAAKAHGDLMYDEDMDAWIHVDAAGNRGAWWHPNKDDGDSRRLEVTLGIKVMPYPIYTFPKHSVIASRCILAATGDDDIAFIGPEVVEPYGDDPRAATRLAVLRTAAAIGEAMQ